jgi:hypothetical protein
VLLEAEVRVSLTLVGFSWSVPWPFVWFEPIHHASGMADKQELVEAMGDEDVK